MAFVSQAELSTAVESGATSRRRFLVWLAAGTAALALPWTARAAELGGLSLGARGKHPDPRPGIDGSKVLTAKDLKGAADLIVLFDAVREMPHIADGIGCSCGCANVEGYRSLLSCYEGVGMAQHCVVCQGTARLAHRRWKEGQTLDQIRRAIDARYGDGS